jgi:hypothetical protein
MRITNTGREVFGSVPDYYPMEGTSGNTGEDISQLLYALFPLPTLPEKAVRPGDSWQSRFQNGVLDLDRKSTATRVTSKFPARGEFVGVEWEMGHPCAKIKNSISAGTKSLEGGSLAARGAAFADDKVELTETIWSALDKGVIVKSVRDLTIDRKMDSQGGGFNAPGFGGAPGAPGGGPTAAGATGGGRTGPPGDDRFQGGKGGPEGLGPQGGGGFGPQGPGRPGMGGFGAPGGQRGGGAPAQVQYMRIRQQAIFTLEK